MPLNNNLLVNMTARIVSAYVAKHVVRAPDLTKVITDVHATLDGLAKKQLVEVALAKPIPPVSIRKSLQNEYLVCLEDGKPFKSLKRHLMAHYNMTPDEYRKKWDLPDDYPMVAPAYAAKRSQLAQASGLGRK